MTYEEAVKAFEKSSKPAKNYLKLGFSYGSFFLLPYEQGVEVLKAFNHAEDYEHNYSGNPKIKAISANQVSVQFFSAEEYRRVKIANLLDVHPDELDALANPPPSNQETPVATT